MTKGSLPYFLVCIIFAHVPVFAQPPMRQLLRADPVVNPVIGRIESPFVYDSGRQPEFATVTFSVPVAEKSDYFYDVMAVSNTGVSQRGEMLNLNPDELGEIHAQVVLHPSIAHHPILIATHRETKEQYFIMDLPPQRMAPVLGAVGFGKSRGSDTRMVMPIFEADADRDIIVQISGERLSAEDVFDMIREQTGCEISELPNGTLTVTGCS